MATTISITLNQIEWTNISNGGTLGYLTNEGNQPIVYIESEVVPDDTITKGHTLKVKDFVNFSIESPAEVYARASSGEGLLEGTVE